jgi:DNA-binding IclR family transcriptional regulator
LWPKVFPRKDRQILSIPLLKHSSLDIVAADDRQGIQSIEVGAVLLHRLNESPRALSLKELALRSDMSAAKAHRYLVSFCRIGLTMQDTETGHYDLGPFALSLGLTRLARTDALAMARPIARQLRDELDLTVSIAVWGNHGPTLVYWLDSLHPIAVNLKVGAVLPIARSSNGRCFAAYLAKAMVQPLLPKEDWPLLVEATKEVRQHNAARAQSDLLPGINSFSAAVFDAWGVAQLVISVIGHNPQFTVPWSSPVLKTLLNATQRLSSDLGYRADLQQLRLEQDKR